MPTDPGANPRDKAIAIGAIVFFVVAFIILYFLAQMTGTPPPEAK